MLVLTRINLLHYTSYATNYVNHFALSSLDDYVTTEVTCSAKHFYLIELLHLGLPSPLCQYLHHALSVIL